MSYQNLGIAPCFRLTMPTKLLNKEHAISMKQLHVASNHFQNHKHVKDLYMSWKLFPNENKLNIYKL